MGAADDGSGALDEAKSPTATAEPSPWLLPSAGARHATGCDRYPWPGLDLRYLAIRHPCRPRGQSADREPTTTSWERRLGLARPVSSAPLGHVPQIGRGRTQAVAPTSKWTGWLVIFATHQLDRPGLNERASRNMAFIMKTLLVSQPLSDWLRALAPSNMLRIPLTAHVFQVPIGCLKRTAPQNTASKA